ncbi:hypothetical protein [Mycobacterium pseudokansasii]|uniref:hypothetical protein n=1 Tax=Mycobacterium pseudokansasii TaxID=2341080 RepID=UPI0007B52839|nr:hypothetical protein [Mycobacterium pseudokansasii]KZS65309.1 mammalian cell entry protein [Mycobacterium kansasii]
MTAIAHHGLAEDDIDAADEIEEGSARSVGGDSADSVPAAPRRRRLSAQGWALLFGLVVVVTLGGLSGWWGLRIHQAQQAQEQRSRYLQVARQSALNLTTIDWQHAEADVRRILDGATGEFYTDFSKRSQPFIEVLQQAKATTAGTVTEAGLESETADGAEVLVAVSVQTSNAGEPEPVPRAWRMRISVQRVDGQLKVKNVGFVS